MDPAPKRYTDLHNAKLTEMALFNDEGHLADNGAFYTNPNEHSHPCPKDRYIVQECSTNDLVDWSDTNRPFEAEHFDRLWNKVEDDILQNDHYVNHLEVGDHPNYYLPLEITTQTAWHSMFARNIFVCAEQFNTKGKQTWRVLHAADFKCSPELDGTHSNAAVIIHFSKRKVLIVGTHYAGELKKALFTVQNFLLPEKDVLPLHCAANVGETGDVCLFFGSDRTGKSSLAINANRHLLGDDEHGWGKETIFNFEGGCYEQTYNLSKGQDPATWHAIRFGTIIENVPHNAYTHSPDYKDTRLGVNGRCCYPLSHVENSLRPSRAGEPNTLIYLCCDVFGVMPLVSRLTSPAAIYHFLSGYTANVTTNKTEPKHAFTATFSPCYSSPFMPRPATVYAKLFGKRIAELDCKIFLINTGWQGGSHYDGTRISISTTRAIIDAIQRGQLNNTPYEHLDTLNLDIPRESPNASIATQDLHPKNAWEDKAAYEDQSKVLSKLFINNMKKYSVSEEVQKAGPQLESEG